VHTALGLSVHASLLCTYEQQSNSLSGGVRLPADWWHVQGQPCDDQLIVEEEKIKRAT